MASLKLIQGGVPGREYPLEGRNRWVLGRSPECDVILDAAAVSRRHVILTEKSDQFFVEDLGSRNGTYVNGQRVENEAKLNHGDQLLICDLLFELVNPRGDQRSATSSQTASLLKAMQNGEDDQGSTSTVMATIDVSRKGMPHWQYSAKPETQLEAILEISNNLSNTLSVDEILPKLLDSLFKIFVQADRGFVIMRPEPGAPLVPVASKARREEDEANMRISRTIVAQAIDSKKAILSADASADERFNLSQSISEFQIRSLICAPLISNEGESMGVIQIDTKNQHSRFTDQDLEVLVSVANQAAVAMDNARMHEEEVRQRALQRDLEVASQMQHALLPAAAPQVPGYHFFEFYESAYRVGGDYYDYITLPEERVAVVVGDVAGKGVSAAILMAKLSSDVRFWLAREANVAAAMCRINAAFSRPEWEDRFVTMVAAVINPREHRLSLVNAGHMPPILRNHKGETREIGSRQAGLPIGVLEDYQYDVYEQELKSGDFVTIFTDGFSEAMNSNRELFGLKRLAEAIGDVNTSSHDLGAHVLQIVKQFAGDYPQSDDMCLVCFGRDGK